MIPIMVGLALVWLGVHRFRRQYVLRRCRPVPGTVVGVTRMLSTLRGVRLSGRKNWLYRPVVSVEHPLTGRRLLFEPDEYSDRTYTDGESVELSYDDVRGRFLLVSSQPWRELLLIPAAGIAIIALQIADWVT